MGKNHMEQTFIQKSRDTSPLIWCDRAWPCSECMTTPLSRPRAASTSTASTR